MILSYCNPKYDKYYVYSHSAVVEPTATRTTNNFVGAHRSEQFDISSVFDCRFCCGSAVSRWRIQRIIVSRKNKAFVSKKIFFLKLEGYCVIWCTWDENPSVTISGEGHFWSEMPMSESEGGSEADCLPPMSPKWLEFLVGMVHMDP